MKVIESVSEFHQLLGVSAPQHPLVSVINLEEIQLLNTFFTEKFSTNFYSISLKKEVKAKMKYGQNFYDFDKGVLSFTAPKQIQSVDFTDSEAEEMVSGKGLVLFFHPEFLAKYPIAAMIKHFGFFSYSVNEALHLSEKEEENINEILLKIKNEYQHIDAYTQDVIISQIELLLNYCNRYYQRQFFTRKSQNTNLLIKMEQILNDYFDSEEPLVNGLPTVEFIANKLNLSTHYLTDMLRVLTGQNTQQHIQGKILEKAKEYLLSTDISISEIAYQLGFEYPQSFNKMFKKKMEISPLEFRQSFN